MNDDIRPMSFLDLLDFLDSSPDVAIVPTRLRNILQSTHKTFPFSTVEEYLNAGDEASELLMQIPNFGRQTEIDLRRVVRESMNAMSIGVSVSGYDQVSAREQPLTITISPTQLETPIAQLALPAQYQKLIKRISAVADHVVSVQDLINLDPDKFAEIPTVGKL